MNSVTVRIEASNGQSLQSRITRLCRDYKKHVVGQIAIQEPTVSDMEAIVRAFRAALGNCIQQSSVVIEFDDADGKQQFIA